LGSMKLLLLLYSIDIGLYFTLVFIIALYLIANNYFSFIFFSLLVITVILSISTLRDMDYNQADISAQFDEIGGMIIFRLILSIELLFFGPIMDLLDYAF